MLASFFDATEAAPTSEDSSGMAADPRQPKSIAAATQQLSAYRLRPGILIARLPKLADSAT